MIAYLRGCIRQRVKVQTLFVARSHPGTMTALHKYEGLFVATFAQMARMRQSLSPSQCVSLINSMISGTEAEKDLIAFKAIHSYGTDGRVGVGY